MEQIPRNDHEPQVQPPAQENQQAEQVRVDAAAFGAKYQSKREVYRFLTHDCGLYLPDYATATIYHMKDIAAGKRRWVKLDRKKDINVPNFEKLTVDTMLHYAKARPEVMEALPMVKHEREKLPREYIANVIYTIVGDPFKKWVDQKVDERHQHRREVEDQI